MPRVIADLKGFDQYAWVTTIYLLAQTSVIPIVGKLGDLYGRKWLTVAGVVIFLVGSVLCGAANSMLGLIAFRGIQGLGAGMLMATVFTLIADIFPDPAHNQAYVGGPKEYQAYQQLRADKKLSREDLQDAEMYQDATMEWSLWEGGEGVWGPMGGPVPGGF